MEEQVTACFGRTRDAEIYLSQPGLGQILAARVLGELGDDEHRYATARNRMNHAGTSPITRASGKRKTVLARFIHNDRLVDALHQQAFCALSASPGAGAYYDELRGRGMHHHAPCGSCPTGWSASCTAASKPAHPMTNTPPGRTHNQDQQAAS